jgi:hypothetical protein
MTAVEPGMTAQKLGKMPLFCHPGILSGSKPEPA